MDVRWKTKGRVKDRRNVLGQGKGKLQIRQMIRTVSREKSRVQYSERWEKKTLTLE